VIYENSKKMIPETYYPNACTRADYKKIKAEKNTLSLKKYSKVTFDILGFYPDGSIFFGD
jgi:hypothetical protein